MSSDDEDDYLSAKFLVDSTPAQEGPKTYSQIRKEARKKGELKHEQQRPRGRKERELEAREEGLSKSLFQRAQENQEAGIDTGNKALSIMMKMGFKPGQTLGARDPDVEGDATTSHDEDRRGPSTIQATSSRAGIGSSRTPAASSGNLGSGDEGENRKPGVSHLREPLPINEWAGALFRR